MVNSIVRKLRKMTVGECFLMLFIYVFTLFFMFITLYPFLHILSVSLSSPAKATRIGLHFFPEDIQFESYRKVFSMRQLGVAYINTIYSVILGTFVKLFFTALTAYPLSRKRMIWNGPITMIFVFTMMFGGGLVPFYLQMRRMGMLNSLTMLQLMGVVNVYYMIIIKNTYQGIPDSLEEAARIDGANDFFVFWRVMLPLSVPTLVTIGLFFAVGIWNSYFSQTIYITDPNQITLQVLLRKLIITGEQSLTSSNTVAVSRMEMNSVESSLVMQDKYAVVIVSVVPILCVYPFLQKHFVKGVLIGSIKG